MLGGASKLVYGSRITEVSAPIWSEYQTLSDAYGDLTFIAPDDGVVFCRSNGIENTSTNRSTAAITVEGATAIATRTDVYDTSVWCPVKKGQTLKIYCDGRVINRYFFKFK